MKTVAILLLAFVAMASSQVNVVDNNNPGGVKVVDNSDPNKVHVVEQPDPVHVAGNSGQGLDSAFYRPSGPSGGSNGIIDDVAFGRPSANYPQQPSINPTFVVDSGFYQPSYPPPGPYLNPFFVDQGFYRPTNPNAPNIHPAFVDPSFYRPSAGGGNNGPYQQQRPYPPKQYSFPGARDGK